MNRKGMIFQRITLEDSSLWPLLGKLLKLGWEVLPHCPYTVLPPGEKPLNRVVSSRRVEKRRETHKINRNIWQTKRSSLGEEFVIDRSTKRNKTSSGSIYSSQKCSGISRFHNDIHRDI
ncbi:hypothetical protein AVEN_220601-1 [Araneus ventricosus]|uniref:Uncharacterized protein n=1 Tax=Araneus ventricosus TaxID=182803 RepID=A0A4Y2UFY8_ARAVE|nr:hypothetical protein AVEN_220601-1 [Araneus ventricosus]